MWRVAVVAAVASLLVHGAPIADSDVTEPSLRETLLQLHADATDDTVTPSVSPSPSPTPSIPTYTVEYRAKLKTDTCDYLYDLSAFLFPYHYGYEPVREGLLHAAKAAGCWHGGWGANYLQPELYRPIRGDQGPHPDSGHPYIIKAKFVDKTVVAVNIKEHETVGDLADAIAYQVGKTANQIRIYRNSTMGHPLGYNDKMEDINFKFQDEVYVDYDLTHQFGNEASDRQRENGLYRRRQDPHYSHWGSDPNN